MHLFNKVCPWSQHCSLQALAAIFGVNCKPWLQEQKCTTEESTCTLLNDEEFLPRSWVFPNNNTVYYGMTKQNTACWVYLWKPSFFLQCELVEMWFVVYIGLMLPPWMNEIPFSKNIMSACVRAASRLVESLAPVNKKTWTVPQHEMETELGYCIFHVDFAIVRLLLPAVMSPP